ncbi:MAG TPA: RES family NAD+ phosphorylase [Acidobacteriaceae bacterium]|nr:RES family NAD+ phosphorylase [Acidobacteriaceae bacterium]
MILWRIGKHAALDGAGGLLVAGRWHSRGHPVVYCSLNPATCLLETLVHVEIDAEDRPDQFQLLQIRVPNRIVPERLALASLPRNWEKDLAATQAIGDKWLASRRSLLLEVPSVLAPETWNVLINPAHKQARLLKLKKIYQHPFDKRLR